MNNEKKHSRKTRANQGSQTGIPKPNKIAASTTFDFDGKNLTPYGGLFPVATMLEKLGFQKLVEETLRVKRIPRVMTIYQFVLAMVMSIYIGFSRLNHIRFVANDPMLTGVLKVSGLPGQSVFWRFLASLHLTVARQLLQLQSILRQRVWEAANVQLSAITVDTDTHQGAVSHKHLDYYLDEFTFRFNRRKSMNRGKLFYRLVQQSVAIEPVTLDNILHPERKKNPPQKAPAKEQEIELLPSRATVA